MNLDQLEGALELEYTPSFVNNKPKKFSFKRENSAERPPTPPPPSAPIPDEKRNEFLETSFVQTKEDRPVQGGRRQSMMQSPKTQQPPSRNEVVPKKKAGGNDEWSIPLPQLQNFSFAKSGNEKQKNLNTPQSYSSQAKSLNDPQNVPKRPAQRGFLDQIKQQQYSIEEPKKDSLRTDYVQNELKASLQTIRNLKTKLQEQKQYYQQKLEQARTKHREEKQGLKQSQREMRLKLEVKQLEVKRLMEVSEIEKNYRHKEKQEGNVSKLMEKLQGKLEEMERRDTNASKNFDPSLALKASRDLQEVNSKTELLNTKTLEFERYQMETRKEISEEKRVLIGEYKRLEDLQRQVLEKERKLESEFNKVKAKLFQETESIKMEYESKLKDLELQKQSANHQKQLATDLQTTYQSKYRQLLEQVHEKSRQTNYQKLKVEEKSIEYNNLLKQISMKNDEIQHLRLQLKNKVALADSAYKKSRDLMGTQGRDVVRERLYDTYTPSDLGNELGRTEQLVGSGEYVQSDFKQSLTNLKNQYLKSMHNLRADSKIRT